MRDQILSQLYGPAGCTAETHRRSTDLAEEMNVSHDEVLAAIEELLVLGLVKDWGKGAGLIWVALTEAGIRQAQSL